MLEALEREVAKSQEKERQLKQIEVFCQRKKEQLLKQHRNLLPPPSTCSETNKDGRSLGENGSGKQQYSEVLNLLVQIRDLEERKQTLIFYIRNTAAAEEMCTVSQALKLDQTLVQRTHQMRAKQVCADLSPLEHWYMHMLDCEDSQAEHESGCSQLSNSKKSERLRVLDKLVCSLAFKQASEEETRVFKDSTHDRSSTKLRQKDPSIADDQLSFTTRRNGVCVHVLITKQLDEKSCVPLSNLGHNTQTPVWNDRPVTIPSKNMYTFSTDPYVPGVSERGIDFLQHKLDPVEFLQEILWPAIDLEFGTM